MAIWVAHIGSTPIVERFNIELSTQKALFRNECVLLLGEDAKCYEIFPEDRRGHPNFRPILARNETDERISQRMNERENDSYKQLAALLGLIGETLEFIFDETQRYRQEQLGDNASPPSVSKLIAKLPYGCLANADL